MSTPVITHTLPAAGPWGLDGRAPFLPRRNEKSVSGVDGSFWFSRMKNGGGLTFKNGFRHPKKPERPTMSETNPLYAKIIAKAWRDPAFKAELIAKPAAVLKAEGIDVPVADGWPVVVL